MPRANRDFWREKLTANEARDRVTDSLLREAGWAVIRVWEHDDVYEAADRVIRLLKASTARPG